jgi:hypothetical protein
MSQKEKVVLPGERYYWLCRAFGKVEIVRPFKPWGREVGESICKDEYGNLFIFKNNELRKT